MPRGFVETRKAQPIPTSIEGVFVRRDTSKAVWDGLRERSEKAKNADEGSDEQREASAKVLLDIFQHVVVGDDGKPFPDLTTLEEVESALEEAPMTLMDLPDAISSALEGFVGKSGRSPRPS